MDDVAVIEIGRRGRQRQLTAGSTVYNQGEIADSVYLVVSGRVRSTMKDRHNQVWSFFDLAISGPGDLLGGSATVMDRWGQTATAASEVVLLQIPRAEWLDLLQAYPQLAFNLAAYAIERLEKSQQRFMQFSGAFTAEKVAMILEARVKSEGVPAAKSGWMDIPSPITHDELGSMVGTTRESVVAAMRKLDGIVDRNGKQYSVNSAAMEKFLKS
jgi:CRP-like cAMP-binding protein